MSNSRALIKHIEALNAESEKWADYDPENRFASKLTTMPDHWADYDVFTPEEFDRYLLEEDYRGLHKEYYGSKVSFDLDNLSNDELETRIDQIVEALKTELDYDEDDELEHEVNDWLGEQMLDIIDDINDWDELSEDFDDVTKMKQIFH